MIKLAIEKIEGYIYYLLDENNKSYKVNIEFYDLPNNPNVGDYLYMNQKLLQEGILSFGPLDGKYGRKIENSDDVDLLVLVANNQRIYLKRFYG